jgi:glycosylphosphatidylinositol phospholipase D
MDWLTWSWYFPLEDIAEVYQELGYDTVTPAVLSWRTFMLFLGAVGNRIAGDFLWPWLFAAESPFLAEQFQDYFTGGLDSMAVHTMLEWPVYIDIMENGQTAGATGQPATGLAHADEDPVSLALGFALWRGGWVEVDVEPTERGVTYRARMTGDWPTDDKARATPSPRQAPHLASDIEYEYLGKSLTAGDFDGDGALDLLVGAPGYGEPGEPQLGAAHVYYAVGEDGLSRAADQTLWGPEAFGSFGWAVAAVDLNRDGLDDAAISAPTVGAETWDYEGAVYVFFGRPDGLRASPDLTVAGGGTYANFGGALAAGDANADGFADLLVGSPYARGDGVQRGSVAAFYSRDNWTADPPATIDDADWLRFGEADYDGFGWAVDFVDRGEAGRLILIGAPGVDLGAQQAVGRLYAFDPSGATAPEFTVTGDEEFDRLGEAIGHGDLLNDNRTLLVVAAPTKSTAGRPFAGAVHFFDLDALAEAGRAAPLATVFGENAHARFGWRLAAGRINADDVPDLVIAEPWRDNDLGRMSGQLYIWMGGAELLAELAEPAQALWQPAGESAQSLFGDALAVADVTGDGHGDLLVGAYRDSRAARHGGSVTLLATPAPTLASVTPAIVTASTQAEITLTGDRFIETGLRVFVRSESTALTPINVDRLDPRTLVFDLAVPVDTPPGLYDVSVETAFGRATLVSALTVEPATDDDDGNDDDDDSTTEPDADEEDDSGCGC